MTDYIVTLTKHFFVTNRKTKNEAIMEAQRRMTKIDFNHENLWEVEEEDIKKEIEKKGG